MAFSVVPWAQVIDGLPLADLLASHAWRISPNWLPAVPMSVLPAATLIGSGSTC